jgi:hypothetical protein
LLLSVTLFGLAITLFWLRGTRPVFGADVPGVVVDGPGVAALAKTRFGDLSSFLLDAKIKIPIKRRSNSNPRPIIKGRGIFPAEIPPVEELPLVPEEPWAGRVWPVVPCAGV